ncbi:patatin-like phospholipase family protein [Phnomibacter ginsenosidimutans]|uniref:Patatin n=1 Tax=Phnomibacter ginsenosidimutans TaxID=2676868 RepID=A0A6I6GJM3_9BACT|nr:patatin-like phospholipase family protein [Phnomibacter ginsenosidimutans]QGW27858.1 patatin [Phnomibacter ginsenosidimutans]
MARTKIRILSLDGGGIRGIIPATIMVEIENRLQQRTNNPDARIADFVDLVAGTSTGGILTSIYLCPGANNRPKFAAKDALELYLNNGKDIFQMEFLSKVAKLYVVFNEMYPSKHIEKLLAEYFGDTELDDLLRPCLITAYDIRNRRAHFFNSVDARGGKKIYNYKLKDVCRATSAAPTYFEPAKISSEQGADYTLVDGGVFVNNPALAAYSEARTIRFSKEVAAHKPDFPSAKDMLIISVGTGTVKTPYHYDKIKNAGLIAWLPIVIDIMMSGNSETVHYHLQKMFNTLSEEDEQDYYRLEPALQDASSEMDDVSDENLKNLHEAGLHYVAKHDALIEEIVSKLIAYA